MKYLIYFAVYSVFLFACNGADVKKYNIDEIVYNSDLFLLDLKKGKNVVKYFDTVFFEKKYVFSIYENFNKCNVGNSNFQYVKSQIKHDQFGVYYELEYWMDMPSCGEKKVFITYKQENINKIIGLHVESKN